MTESSTQTSASSSGVASLWRPSAEVVKKESPSYASEVGQGRYSFAKRMTAFWERSSSSPFSSNRRPHAE